MTREEFWQKVNAEFAALRANESERNEYMAEIESLESTLMDGLDGESA